MNEFYGDQEKIVLQDLENTAKRIGELTRYIGFGIIATIFSILLSENSVALVIKATHSSNLKIILLIAIIIIFLDYIQSIIGYFVSLKAYKTKTKLFNKNWLLFKCRQTIFYFKQLLLFACVVLLISTLYKALP